MTNHPSRRSQYRYAARNDLADDRSAEYATLVTVLRFDTRRERDSYIKQHADYMSLRPISKRAALRLGDRGGRDVYAIDATADRYVVIS